MFIFLKDLNMIHLMFISYYFKYKIPINSIHELNVMDCIFNINNGISKFGFNGYYKKDFLTIKAQTKKELKDEIEKYLTLKEII